MCGIPGSGKSTWLKNHRSYFAEESAIISRDEIRFNMLEDGDDYFAKEKEVWTEYVAQTINSLKFNVDTILDATHLNEGSRAKILKAIKNHLEDVEINIIVIHPTLDVAISQNNQREGRSFVPLSVIRRMNSQMTLPTLEEGFDHIYIYEEENGKIKYQIIEKGAD